MIQLARIISFSIECETESSLIILITRKEKTCDKTVLKSLEETIILMVAENQDLPVKLLEESFNEVKPQADAFGSSFYQNLFTMYPEAKPLFANTDLAAQQKKLISSLVLVVENLQNPEKLQESLKGLGARHVQYGALPEHYPLVGNALLKTFEDYLQEKWTPEVKQAWVDAYGAITKIMLEGADYSDDSVQLSQQNPKS